MKIARTRPRPRVARVLFGAVLTAIMAFSVGGTAAGAVERSGDFGTMARTDVYMKDIASDTGYEPHGAIYSSFFNSPDIKLCPYGIECAAHTNPVVGSTSYIFVNLRNNGPYGSGISNGTLRAYYTTSGGGANWPAHWTPIGSKTLPVAPGVTTTSIAWDNVPSLGHFCLLLRWESATDPMLFEGTSSSINTQYNNNIAWKNANTVPAFSPGSVSVRPYALANALAVPAKYDLAFRPLGEPVPGAKIVADLGPEMFARWRAAGAPGEGIQVVGNTSVQIVDPYKAQIRDLLINPNERPVLSLSFSTGQTLQKPYTLQVVQVGPAQEIGEKYDVGGVDYTFDPKR
ncbi:hypothetical protein C5N14_17295 [Micromonospora sp. MW-13]|uniref:hypothetical protein n=1 Tax=unclassified Micromonospora TaxID=2617518 RepID=UPI000ED8807C|nr:MULTISPECIES: hypothetical protein [unclassified Micromonospora]MCX4472117.1 hypothetical protein [Micromonospora sp. NBC_01655]RGC67534.1 hypothetical protein C5N14_17295 [Micromonospora sp. MW-13]